MSGIFLAVLPASGVRVALTTPVTLTFSSGGVLPAVTGYRIANDAFVYTAANSVGSYIQQEQWCSVPGAVGDFEARVTASGDTPSGTLGSWVSLSSTQTWALNASPGNILSTTLTVEIRRASDAVVVATATVNMLAEAV